MNALPVTEMFVSLQGEGMTQGLPTTFIRLAGCNLRCSYCDTPYSLETNDGVTKSVKDIVEWVNKQWPVLVCITGGEPLIHGSNLAELVNALLKSKSVKEVSIETNGTLSIIYFKRLMGFLGDSQNLRFIMDIKMPTSVSLTPEQIHITGENLKYLSSLDETKFVVSDELELTAAVESIRRLNPPNPIISPVIPEEGRTPDWLGNFANDFLRKELKFTRLQVQLHKTLWGNKRGV